MNLAARLQQAGQPGGVLVSEATHRLASRDFVTEDRGELTVKGIDHPVRAFAVTGARAQRTRFDSAVERGLSPLVGREGEFEFLADCCERVGAGRGQAVSLVGDAGSGKSRLAYELRRRLEGTSFGFLQGRLPSTRRSGAVPDRRRTSALAVRARGRRDGKRPDREAGERGRATRSAARVGRAVLQAAVRAAGARARDRGPRSSAAQAPHARSDQGAGVPRGRRPPAAASRRGPAVDRPQLRRGAALADRRARRPAHARSLHLPLGLCPPWQERSFHQRLALEPLAPAAAMRMVGALLPAPDARSLCDLVVDAAEGNPFFIEELAGYLRGARRRGGRRRTRDDPRPLDRSNRPAARAAEAHPPACLGARAGVSVAGARGHDARR